MFDFIVEVIFPMLAAGFVVGGCSAGWYCIICGIRGVNPFDTDDKGE